MSAGTAEHTGLLRIRVSNKTHVKVKPDDVLAFFQQLSTMFRAGTPIYDSITISGTQRSRSARRTAPGSRPAPRARRAAGSSPSAPTTPASR
ncbi:MAG TPA: hypothetical protein VFD43_12460 [Planctomycetota bacterium]|nr:hypothetical protein [Planctomycetota bacterium]